MLKTDLYIKNWPIY